MLASLLFHTAQSLPEWRDAKSILFIRGVPCPELLTPENRSRMTCLQSFYPFHHEIRAKGVAAIASQGEAPKTPDIILYLGTKFKHENIATFHFALSHLKPGGAFLCALPNDLGASRFEKILFGIAKDEPFSYSKSKARVFGVRNFSGSFNTTGDNADLSSGGIFGAEKIDTGSQLLIEACRGKLKGAGADLGAGTGFLTREALLSNPDITSVILFEAEKNSLLAAENLLLPFKQKCTFQWCDVTTGVGKALFDWVICNPPFHYGKDSKPSLGIAFIKAAFQSLKAGATAFFVQNKHLPYLEEARKLGNVSLCTDTKGYIVWTLTKAGQS